ncbi:MAG: TolC family protein [Candidatus Omnitrophica bacterium]|nr:TolC family protein [Candidatus Omnitrophota bacterium]
MNRSNTRPSNIFLIALLSLALGSVSTVCAQEPEVHSFAKAGLSLDEAFRLALAHNFQVRVALLDQQDARQNLMQARSRYDTTLNLGVDYSMDKREQSSVIMGTKSTAGHLRMGLSKDLPTGTTLGLDWVNTRSTSSSGFVANPELYDEQLRLSAHQDLLQNFAGIVDRGTVRLTELSVDQIDLDTLNRIESTLAEVSDQYYAWAEAGLAVEIQEMALQKAEELLEIFLLKKDRGVVEDRDLLASRANVEARRADLLLTRAKLETLAEGLAFLLQVPSLKDSVPTEGLNPGEIEISAGEALKRALKQRRDLRQAELDLEKETLGARIARSELLPQLDLYGAVSGNRLDEHFESGRSPLFTDEHPTYEVGITGTLPLENRRERAAFKQARLRREKAELALEELQKNIVVEIADAVRQVETAKTNSSLREKIADLQAQKLKAEENQFELGRSRSKDVIDFQQDLYTSQLLHNASLLAYRRALTKLQLTQNQLLVYFEDEIKKEFTH